MLPAWFAIGSRPMAVQNDTRNLPDHFYLAQNYPNPFNPETVINYQLPVEGNVTLTVYNLLGDEAAVLVRGHQDAGSYQVVFDGSKLAGGVYLYRLKVDNFSATRRMVLLR